MPSYKLNNHYLRPAKCVESTLNKDVDVAKSAGKKATLLLNDVYKVIQYSGDVQQFLHIDDAPINQFILDVEPKFNKFNLSEIVKNVRLFGETITNIIKVDGEYYKFIAEPKKLGIRQLGIKLTFIGVKTAQTVKSAILEYSSDWHFCISSDGIITDYHSPRSSFCNVSSPSLGQPIDVSYPAKLSALLMNGVDQAFEKGGYEIEGKNLSMGGMCFFIAKFYKVDRNTVFVKVQDTTQGAILRKTLERENKQYRTAFDNSPVSMAIISPKGRFVHSNKAFYSLNNFTAKTLKYHTIETFFVQFIENGENFIKKIQNFEDKIELDVTFVESFGSDNVAKISLRNVYDKLEEIQYVIFSVSLVKTITQKVVEVTNSAMTTSKIEELERFAYAVSHDLREPLRTVKSFADLLSSRYSKELTGDAKEYLDFILDGASNMNMLIEDLLAYSKVSTEIDDNFNKEVELNQLIHTIVTRNLYTQIEETNAQIILEPTVQRIKGVRVKLMQLFQNLISNAIKFRKPNSIPIVTITMEENEQYYNFKVTDNGIGIKDEYKDKIFQVFRKLHNKRQYKGSGIGLAICKKIVEQHDGNIYLTSTVGEGTTFHFTIKKN